MNSQKPKLKIQTPSSFPPAWLWLFDEAVPTYVKQNYSPMESWKSKPFSPEDARFFFRGIEELSDLFTEERPKGMPPYFQHPKYRSGYLLYFLPLQTAKFLTLYQMYSKAVEAAIQHGKKTGTIRIVDLGAGPGTATIALLLLLLDPRFAAAKDLPSIEILWFDTNKTIMNDGVAITEQLASLFPRLRGKVTVKTFELPWWKAAPHLKEEISLTLIGHVLNEASGPKNESSSIWETLFERNKGGGTLFLEPAARRPSQLLSQIRNELAEMELIPNSAQSIWGPCLHAGTCPLSTGRDWCHFSVPTAIPGKWFKLFSENLSSERQWVKFSYLWLSSKEHPSPRPAAQDRRVISDPLSQAQGPQKTTVLICEPETPGRLPVSAKDRVRRGDISKIDPRMAITRQPRRPADEDEDSDNDFDY